MIWGYPYLWNHQLQKVHQRTVRVLSGVQHVEVIAGGAAIQRLVREEEDLQPDSEEMWFQYPVNGL